MMFSLKICIHVFYSLLPHKHIDNGLVYCSMFLEEAIQLLKYVQTGGQEAEEEPCRKGSGSLGRQQVESESPVCPDSQEEGQPCPGVHEIQHC